MKQDEDHLRLLSIFHYVVGGLAGVFALFPIFHLIVGLVFVLAPANVTGHGGAPPAFFGWLFIFLAAAIMGVGFILAFCILLVGRFLNGRKHYWYCLVMAGIECVFMPFGTVLGVFTIIVLMRESVKELFLGDPAASYKPPANF